MLDVRAGDLVVVGHEGVRIDTGRHLPTAGQPRGDAFGFMSSDVSSEKPQQLLVQQVAAGMRAGVLRSGIMHACVEHGVDPVLPPPCATTIRCAT